MFFNRSCKYISRCSQLVRDVTGSSSSYVNFYLYCSIRHIKLKRKDCKNCKLKESLK